jgi:hypothetical protein
VRVLYVYDDAETIDWPSLYYLNDEYGCRIDLLRFDDHPTFHGRTREITDRQIFAHEYWLDTEDTLAWEKLTAELFAQRRPDVVILGDVAGRDSHEGFVRYLVDLPPLYSSPFNIEKIYARSFDRSDSLLGVKWVNLSSRELASRYRERMDREVPQLFAWFSTDQLDTDRLARYRLIHRRLETQQPDVDFLSGIETLRLVSLLDAALPDGAMKRTYVRNANRYVEHFRSAGLAAGAARVDYMTEGYRYLSSLDEPLRIDAGGDPLAEHRPYFHNLLDLAERATLQAVGLEWDSRVDLRDSPHGPRVKLTLAFSVEGPREVTVTRVQYQPYWDSAAVALDTMPRRVGPHQSFVREYLVDIAPEYLQTREASSLAFEVTLKSGNTPLTMTENLSLWEIPGLSVTFEPPYHFVPPVARLEVDRIISSMAWNVRITKPRDFDRTVHLSLETPRGVFAGAYRQDVDLTAGNTGEMIRIPFSVTQLFELGTQHAVVSLSLDDRPAAADTGLIRIASCNIGDTVRIGFLPDTAGALEDILRMTNATHRPLTERTLQVGNLAAYDVILIGSGALRNYPSFRGLRDRLEEYIRWGGSLVVFGQGYDWPDKALPFALVPSLEEVEREDIRHLIDPARILNVIYPIKVNELLSFFENRRRVAAAVLRPSETVLATETGAGLLSVARLGEGQVIYCGLPLTDMIARLNLEAIHLFANIMNY